MLETRKYEKSHYHHGAVGDNFLPLIVLIYGKLCGFLQNSFIN